MHKQGLKMLKIFKSHGLNTSILDDFMYYENRQKMMQEERARLLVRSFHTPFSVSILDPPRRLMNIVSGPASEGRINDQRDTSHPRRSMVIEKEQVPSNPDVTAVGPTILTRPKQQKILESKDNAVSSLKIGSLTISPLQVEPPPPAPSTVASIAPKSETRQAEVVTVGSISVEVNGFNGTSGGSLTVGSIPLDARALQGSKDGAPTKVANAAK
ncbi:hypothetical protein MLD38_023625 [Melastoma candidum]|nr:hypothetical protein MLD38_023625 [Melastoma candidum]